MINSAEEFDGAVVVAANGCTDRTAAVARGYGATVIELTQPSKVAALNAADAVAAPGPRIYLDADAELSPALVRSLVEAVSRVGVEAAVPRPRMSYGQSSWPVRAYYSISEIGRAS